MKKYILLVAVVFAFGKVKAQSGYNYNSFGIGAGASLVQPLADLKKSFTTQAYHADLTYYYNPYIPIVLEFQWGNLKGGGNTVAEDKDTRRFENKYKALMVHLNYQLGDGIDYYRSDFLNLLKNFYAGVGIGAIFNNVDRNQYSLLDPAYLFPGSNKSVNVILPLRFGYEFKIYDYYGVPKFGIDIGYQHNITFGEGLDGYADPVSQFKNNASDQYRQITIGIKYNFGHEASYDKSIGGN
ncbi:outer membrane beta-barrel protein [Mucilaginibacter psychrotolerans]|uniref:outer membrane beta-barrel protein n=1 Tax=Mucilaginibacter psychrotolerans TaxID=1524096 RepID=UPI0013053E69|nr:outer membrane beta-barrel protein [Mucilaginibacter psychrotolerans]